MRTRHINKNLVTLLILGILLSGCSAQRDFLSDNFSKAKATHQRIAILPFDVQFENPVNRNPDTRTQRFFSQQEREASLDTQKELFAYAAKQVEKGRYELAFQDFTKTNSILASSGIRLEDIGKHDKAQLARILGVDAVIWGQLQVVISRQNRYSMMPSYMGNDGVEANVNLYDAATGELLWKTNMKQRPNNRMDTPHHLTSQLIAQVAKHLPYRTK
ncbi:hypothetical protein [Emticicia sp. TH156]|uniref:hypothetical protein n=1 Tax=Emticicia sp. TH156 TaxID=2067454 RepID=UPI000C791F7A|nr:hypothetical protein [Emticicia sp. TH156]PLK46029.1 hypothetical protein C0V77_01375 [Emticicia sp. TH156]